jgi:hypothetical protein
MSDRQILEPYWSSNLKNQIICKFKYNDGREVVASVSQTEGGNPDWNEIFETFTVDQIDANWAERLKRHEENKLRRQMDEQRRADNYRREALFMAKSDAFEVDLVRSSTNTALKSKLRKATSIMEVTILSSMIALENFNMQKVSENGKTPTANTP